MAGKHINPEIEVLRAFAVIFVFFGHINTLLTWRQVNFEEYFNFGVGVDLFFCISGFVITSAFGAELTAAAAGPRSFWRTAGAFWIRRIFRIWPLSWAVFLATSLMMLYLNGWAAVLMPGILGDFAAVVLNVQNLHVVACIGSSSPYCGAYFGIYWSLSLEEQFYLAFPFLFLLPRRLMVAALIGAVVLFAFLPRTTLVWFTRVDAIALGVLFALLRDFPLYEQLRPSLLGYRLARAVVFPALLVAICAVPATGIAFYPTMVSVLALVLVYVASYRAGYLIGPGLTRRLLVWVGERSFAIYLLHNTVFWLVGATYRSWFPGAPAGPAKTIPFLLAAILLLAALADLSFRYLETPLRRYGKRIAASVGNAEKPTMAETQGSSQLAL